MDWSFTIQCLESLDIPFKLPYVEEDIYMCGAALDVITVRVWVELDTAQGRCQRNIRESSCGILPRGTSSGVSGSLPAE